MLYGRDVVVKSMTGFGRAFAENESFAVTVEVKSVNHRYFEFTSRLPRGCAFLEDKLKSLCREYISRGKTEISVTLEGKNGNGTAVELNRDYAGALFAALKELSEEYGIENDVKASSLISNSELFTVKKQDLPEDEVQSAVADAANTALRNFTLMRQTEGEKLKTDIENHAEIILGMVSAVEERSPQTVKLYRERLEGKMRELLNGASVDEQRIITETAIFADKAAVDEETVRLRSHIDQLKGLLENGGAVGRKLDFLVQEMNREANTIGSKAQDIEIARTVVDIKSEIEKIREQIQNIE